MNMIKACGIGIIALGFSLCAAPSLGFDVYLNVSDNGDTDVDFEFVPSLILMPSSRFEVVPKAGFNIDMDEYDTEFGLLGGCGFYFHAVKSDPFVLSFGPDFYVPFGFGDNHFTTGLVIGAPLNLDLHLHRRFFLRAGLRLISFSFEIDDRNDETDTRVEYTMDSILAPMAGFYFDF
ncbi:MAG: hypothetical protein GF350_08045 [Chitinivibrionales bacterium]|nr:hypothetical protein [Chitinivibrionales bacterium]